jgi:hypothetical protein
VAHPITEGGIEAMNPSDGPQPLELSKPELEAIQPYIAGFRKDATSPQFQADVELRRQRVKYFQQEFPKRLPTLTESDLLEMYSRLWASQMFTNKLYRVQKILSATKLDKLKDEFNRLRDTTLPVADRYDHFRKAVAYLGPAAVTEIMCYMEPERCGLWNRQARDGLNFLGLVSYVDTSKYQISGSEYETFNRLLAAICEEIEKSGLTESDLLLADKFLLEATEGKPPHPIPEWDHDEVRDTIADIGDMLGFDTQVEFQMGPGAKVDVLWRARIGNLGTVTYVFEVQKSGSIDGLILNLERAKNSPTVQKVIAVSDNDQLQRIKRETEGLLFEFRNALAFWNVSEVQQLGENLQAAMQIIDKLGLVPGKV